MMESMKDKLYPQGRERKFDIWFSPQDEGDYCNVYIVEDGKNILRKVGTMDMIAGEAISFRNGFCEGIQMVIDMEEEYEAEKRKA